MNISIFEKENLGKGLALFIESFRDFIVAQLEPLKGDRWGEHYYSSLSERQQTPVSYQGQNVSDKIS